MYTPTSNAPENGSHRTTILKAFAEWTALSALRSKAPIRSAEEVYGVIRTVGLAEAAVLRTDLGQILSPEFDTWHTATLNQLGKANPKLRDQIGWSAKIINVYLKTFAYVGDGGRPGIRECLHPPIDGGLWRGVRGEFVGRADILADTHCVGTIDGIKTHPIYERIIKGLRAAAGEKRLPLIEIEYLWEHSKKPRGVVLPTMHERKP